MISCYRLLYWGVYLKTDYKKTAIILLNIFIPMFLGGMAYIFFRPDSYISNLFYSVFTEFKINHNYIDMMRSSIFGNVFINYFSDVCWAYALSYSVYYSLNVKRVMPSCFICIIFCSIIEILQVNQIISGTFDIIDIIAEGIVCIVSHFIIYVVGGNKK